MSSGRIQLVDDAPEVNLNVCVVENIGLEVFDDPHRGRIVRATKDLGKQSCKNDNADAQNKEEITTYCPILREKPAIVCPQEDYMAFMEQFLEAPLDIQLGILNMYYQPLDSPMGQSLVEPARLLYFLGVLDDLTVIHQLLCILMTNGHQYRDDQVAMVLFGSKVSHSCQPNTAYCSTAEDGCLEYLLLADTISAGEEVTFSYLSDIYETPTLERRQLLWQTKSFICECARCLEPDFCRCMKCPSCSTVMPCEYSRKGTSENLSNSDQIAKSFTMQNWETVWMCANCYNIADTMNLQQKEREIDRGLQLIDRELTTRQNFDPSGGKTWALSNRNPENVRVLVQECIDELSSTHYLTIKALRLLVTASTTKAYVTIKQNVLRGIVAVYCLKTASFFRMSVVAGIQLVLACECVASNCTGCYLDHGLSEVESLSTGLSITHSPHYDRATPMKHVVENLFQIPIFMWPSNSLWMAYRYTPALRAKFKRTLQLQMNRITTTTDHQEEFMDLLEVIEECWDRVQCLECDTFWDSMVQSVVRAATARQVSSRISYSTKSTNNKKAKGGKKRRK